MNLFLCTLTVTSLIVQSVVSEDVCTLKQCPCPRFGATVNCDGKDWSTLTTIEFPPKVDTLTLVNNRLKFDTINDCLKIENLTRLIDLSLNQNPLGNIPPFNNSKFQSISLQDTSLTSAAFPPSYNGSLLRSIFLSDNKIRTIKEDDFTFLRNSKIEKLHIDSVSLSTIEPNAFIPLHQLQGLSLKTNQLKSCEFLSTLPLLSSINLDGNQFTTLPQQLSSPNKIKTFSFKHNLITVIDESSPLYTWLKMNYTNIQIYLANNSFDCCQSVWFIRFLNSSTRFIADAPLLTCSTPSSFAGQHLIKLNPDQMNCGGILPNKSWWTIGRIVGVSVGGSCAVLLVILIVVVFTRGRRPSLSGYTEIDGIDDPSPATAPPSHLPFPSNSDYDDDDNISSYSTAFTRNTTRSEAPTVITASDQI